MVSFFIVVLGCCNKHLRFKKGGNERREGGKWKERGKGREGKKAKKGHFKEGTVILAQVPYDSVSSQLMVLLLGTGQEQRRPLYCKCDGKKLLDMFPGSWKTEADPEDWLLNDLF